MSVSHAIKKRRLFARGKKSKSSGDLVLQITAMADIFTVLLVFLLKGMASDALQISPSPGTKLPVGYHTTALSEQALKIDLDPSGIQIEKEQIVPLEKGHLPASVKLTDGIIPELNKRIEMERERQKIIAEANSDVKIDTRAIILADEKVPFQTIKTVLRTLSTHGYSDVKFAVVKDQ